MNVSNSASLVPTLMLRYSFASARSSTVTAGHPSSGADLTPRHRAVSDGGTVTGRRRPAPGARRGPGNRGLQQLTGRRLGGVTDRCSRRDRPLLADQANTQRILIAGRDPTPQTVSRLRGTRRTVRQLAPQPVPQIQRRRHQPSSFFPPPRRPRAVLCSLLCSLLSSAAGSAGGASGTTVPSATVALPPRFPR